MLPHIPSSPLTRDFLVKHDKTLVPLPSSPDLTPAKFFWFPKLKFTLKDQCFKSVKNIKKKITGRAVCYSTKRKKPTMLPIMLGMVY